MATARPPRRIDLDRWVAAGSAVGLLAVAAVLAGDLLAAPVRRPPADPIAHLMQCDGGARVRAAGTLVWEAAGVGEPLAAGDSVFVQPGGSATLRFRAGAVVDLDERTLVVVEPPDAEADRVQVLSGVVVAEAGSADLTVQTGPRRARVSPGGALTAGAEGSVELIEGRATVDGVERGAAPRVALVAPPRGHRVYVQEFPHPVALRWDGEAARAFTLEVSRERSFARCVATAPGAAGFLEVSVDRPGPWYWRVVDEDGAPASEVRKLTAVADRPPRPFSPAPGEIVLAPQGVQVPFWWTAVAGAAAYRVEVAADAAFQRVALSAGASGPGLWARLELPEGVYFWRVRAERPRQPEHRSPPSAPVSFRLIRRPVLDAPELFDATIEGAAHAR